MLLIAINTSSAAYPTPGTTSQPAKETGDPPHAADTGGRSVWGRWTAPANGRITITTLGSNFDTLLAAYTGTGVDAPAILAEKTKIYNGLYTAWGYLHMYSLPSTTADEDTFISNVDTQLDDEAVLGSSGLRDSQMVVGRQFDGAVVGP